MKTFSTTQEVKDRVQALFSELHHLCVEHGMPYVAGCILENNGTGMTKAISAYIDGTVGLADSSLIGATEMLKLPSVPPELIQAIQLLGKTDDAAECDCPACQLDRNTASNLH